ncbi:BOI-related E3 ubiquitin-protein ligase 1-like [Henckelia pumila]|uniref:BOI-related E3 ubiquitin-protein ligase 1-like n=1 Tax=Henckelia pumila TaxID=405737 RepID=UPI003C6E6E88
MFGGGGANENTAIPAFLGDNRLPFDNNTLPQLQLFGHAPSVHEHASLHNVAIKRVREEDLVCTRQKRPISSNKNYSPEKVANIDTLPNPNLVSTGLRLSCEKEEQNSSVSSGILSIGNNLKMEMDRQTEEFGRYIKLQEENILKGVRELNHRHTVSLLSTLEKGVNKKLHEKALEVENVNRKNKELADKIKQVSTEAQSWHYRAKYNESVINILKNNIEQLMAQGASRAHEGSGDSEVDDAVSGTNHRQIISGLENRGCQTGRLICRSCKSKEVSILLLPCRHLCLCTDCEGLSDICPVCQVMKTAGVHVHM